MNETIELTSGGPLRDRLRRYHEHTRGALTGFLMGFPLALIYSLLVVFGPVKPGGQDFLIAWQIGLFGERGYAGMQLGLAAAFLLLLIVLQRRGRFEARYFGPLIVEAMVYAALGVLAVRLGMALFSAQPQYSTDAKAIALTSALGEAINQETFFRWLLLEALLLLFRRVARLGPTLATLATLVFGTVIYAAIGTWIDPQAGPWIARAGTLALAGAFFSSLYLLRGYTVTAYCHLFYATFWIGVAPYL